MQGLNPVLSIYEPKLLILMKMSLIQKKMC